MEQYMMYVWLGVIILSVACEALTTQLVSIWFVAGGLAGIIAKLLGAGAGVQIIVAIVVTLLCIVLTRPLVKRLMKAKTVGTNADRYIGEIGTVVEKIDNLEATGQVKVMTSLWSARSNDEELVIPKNASVKVLRIEGVKLIVEPADVQEKME